MTVLIRPARPDDSGEILRLLHLLAAFEGEPGAVATTEETIRADAFGPGRRFEALLAEAGGAVQGMVVLYPAYSSWRGAPTLMVHDLFVEEASRGTGTGEKLLAAAAALAVERGCCRLDVNVVAWNDSGRRFYERLGFKALPDWLPHRLDREGMERLART